MAPFVIEQAGSIEFVTLGKPDANGQAPAKRIRRAFATHVALVGRWVLRGPDLLLETMDDPDLPPTTVAFDGSPDWQFHGLTISDLVLAAERAALESGT